LNGPWARNLSSFTSSLSSMPSKYRSTFDAISSSASETICSKSYLHIWETDSDVDSLLQLTQTIVKIQDMHTYMPSSSGWGPSIGTSMIIICEQKPGRDDFARVCELVRYLTNLPGKPHLSGGVMAFEGIKIVRGIDNTQIPNAHGQYTPAAETSVKKLLERVNKCITRTFASGAYTEENRKMVWHHGPIVHFLNHFIANTTPAIRSALAGVTIHSLLSIPPSSSSPPTATQTSIHPPPLSRIYNTPTTLSTLETYCTRLGIPIVLLDASAQRLTESYLAIYMYYWAYYIHTLLPPSLVTPHYYKAMDALVAFCFKLHGACTRSYGSSVVKTVQAHLSASKAKGWARTCVDREMYSKAGCRGAARDQRIAEAVHWGDAPFALFASSSLSTSSAPDAAGKARAMSGGLAGAGTEALPAFSRLPLGPAAGMIAGHYTSAPIAISFSTLSIKISSESPWHLYIPKELVPDSSPSSFATPPEPEKVVTGRIQGLMMGVLECVRRKKGEPQSALQREREMWEEVVKACCWALDGCKGRLPRGVEEKVGFVERNLRQGTW
ncbi:hypothetical protein K491DRAFT_558088, partial [Lophiostoma macrostomum CBS 122681]